MRLKFVSGKRHIEFDGSGEGAASVISVSGFEGVSKRYHTVRYVGMPGQITVSESVLPRVITVTGDICVKNSRPFSEYCTFFTEKGELYVSKGTVKKKIAYKPVIFRMTEQKGDFILFELKILCDFPYFSDWTSSFSDIYKRIDKVTGAFSLPMVFTERRTSLDVINKGQVECQPVVVVECVESGVYSGGIHIKNESTGKSLVLLTNMKKGEKITLDVKNRTISSDMRDNCYGILSGKCTLANFLLRKGVNSIVVENENQEETVKASLCFDNLYTEAM